MKKSTFLPFLFLLFILAGCSPNEKSLKSETGDPWPGTWTFNDGYVEYTLEVSENYGGRYRCIYTAEGVQAYYVLECIGLATGDALQLKKPTVMDGDFLLKDKIKASEPILTLAIQKDDRVLSYWDQLGNNLPDNNSGKVCFKKQPRKPKMAVENFDQIIWDLRQKDSFNPRAAWGKRGLNQSGTQIIAIMNDAKAAFLLEIQMIKDSDLSEEETLQELHKLVNGLPWDELDTEEGEFLADELSPAIEALGFDPVIIFN